MIPRAPVLVQTWSDLEAVDPDRHVAYIRPDHVPILLRWAAEHGGELWGSPWGGVVGGDLVGVGPVIPSTAAGIDVDGYDPLPPPDALRAAVRALRRRGSDHAVSASSVGLAIVKDRHGDLGDLPADLDALMRDSLHAGPVEYHRAVREAPNLEMVDQRAAYLMSMERGVPELPWCRAMTITPDDAIRIARDPEHCIVLDATWRLPVPCLPRRMNPWGPTVHPVGLIRTCVRGPHVALAAHQGGRILEVHGAMIARRVRWNRATRAWRHWLSQLPPGLHRDTVKATYQRVWGRLARRAGWRGEVEHTQPEPDGARRGWHEDDQGAVHTVRWEPDGDAVTPSRPDIAGEIVSWTAARTWAMAHQVGLDRVALLHVDAVAYLGQASGAAWPPVGWAVKATGPGDVYGHGRYRIGDAEGRMGMEDGEPHTWARGDSPGEASYSVRDWGPGWSSVPVEEHGSETARRGRWPWA